MARRKIRKRVLYFNQAQRKIYGEKSIEFSLLTVGGLILTRAFSEKGISFRILSLGIAFFLIGALISYLFLKGVKGDKNGSA